MLKLNAKRLATAVSERHGIRIEQDDPMMAVVTMHQLILEEMVRAMSEQICSALAKATADLEQAAKRVQVRASATIIDEVKQAVAALRREMNSDIGRASLRAEELVNAAARARGYFVISYWWAGGFGFTLFLIGLVVSRFLFCPA
jgi:hypothetical protein